jgi:hypothetical protein
MLSVADETSTSTNDTPHVADEKIDGVAHGSRRRPAQCGEDPARRV